MFHQKVVIPVLETMFFQFLSENGQAKPLTEKSLKFSKGITFIQYINSGYIMNVRLKHDKILNANHIEKLVSRNALEIESITFTRTY